MVNMAPKQGLVSFDDIIKAGKLAGRCYLDILRGTH